MNNLSLILDSFDNAGGNDGSNDAEIRLQQVKAEAFAEGHAAGQASMTAQLEDDTAFLKDIAASLEQAIVSFPDQISMQICDAVVSLGRVLLPNLSEQGFADEVAAAVKSQISASGAPSLQLYVSPARIEIVCEAISAWDLNEATTVSHDDALDDMSVRIEWQDAGVELDIEKACAQALAALEQTSNTLRTGKENDGKSRNAGR